MRKLLLYLFVFCLVPILAFAQYNPIGFNDGNFEQTTPGNFNTALDPDDVDAQIASFGLSNADQVPIIEDINGDGSPEIIILDSDDITIFNYTQTLDWRLVDSITVGTTDDDYSNIEVADIDGDGIKEVMIASSMGQTLWILNMTGSDLQNQTTLDLSTLNTNSVGSGFLFQTSQHMIKCGFANECVIVYQDSRDIPSPAAARTLYTSYFNSTFVGHETIIDSFSSSSQNFCLPQIRKIEFKDYDPGDGNTEYIYSVMKVNHGLFASDDVVIYKVDVLANGSVIQETPSISNGDVDEPSGNAADDCDASDVGKLFTPPLVAEGGDGGDPEIWIATANDADTFRLYKAESSSSGYDQRFPLVSAAEGQWLGNIIQGNSFGETDGQDDFCAVSFDEVRQTISVVCGSEVHGGFSFNTEQYLFSDVGETFGFNVSDGFDDYHLITHFVDVEESSTEDEILTTYGIFRLDGSNLINIFDNPRTDGASIPVAYDTGSGLFDIIHLQSSSVHYIDDLFSNAGPTIDRENTRFNPCIDSTWKVNTTVEVTVVATDPNDDAVWSDVTLYAGDPNEQLSNSTLVVSGGDMIHSFTANSTIGSGTLRIRVYDEANGLSESETVSFTVASNGLELGDSSCALGVSPDDANATVQGVGDGTLPGTDGISNGVNFISDNFNTTPFTIWVVVMFVIALFGVSLLAGGSNPLAVLALVVVMEVLALIIGAKIGALSTALIFILVILAIIPIAIYIGNMFFGRGSRM